MSWANPSSTDRTLVDPDLYLIHTLVVAATIHLHKDSTMDLKMSQAAKEVVELINYLTEDDYELMDPILSVRCDPSQTTSTSCCNILFSSQVCWSSIVRIFREMIQVANQKLRNGDPTLAIAWTVTYLQSCVSALLSALQNLAVRLPIAGW